MIAADRKAAKAAYRKRQAVAGIVAVRCVASGEIWVGRATDVDSIETRLRFGLRTNGGIHPTMQSAWNDHGDDSFSFDIVERLEHEDLAYVRDATLKQRLAHWRATLDAQPF